MCIHHRREELVQRARLASQPRRKPRPRPNPRPTGIPILPPEVPIPGGAGDPRTGTQNVLMFVQKPIKKEKKLREKRGEMHKNAERQQHVQHMTRLHVWFSFFFCLLPGFGSDGLGLELFV